MTAEAAAGGADGLLDCLIVGGGPAGLTAAIYLGRFLRRVTVVDRGEGRLAMIPVTRNHAGHPDGIAGRALLTRMRAQAEGAGAHILRGTVDALAGREDAFEARIEPEGAAVATTTMRARTVLLATGVVNLRPPLAPADHDDAVSRGLIRYCPICDGFEQRDRHVGILGAGDGGFSEALFMRTYTDRITVLTLTEDALDPVATARLRAEGIAIVTVPLAGIAFAPAGQDAAGGVRVTLADGERLTLDTLYPALGSRTRNELGVGLDADVVGGQCFATDPHQRCSVPGLYAAGDAVEGLDQISVAMGTGARAAVAIHNDLRARDGEGSGRA